MDKYNKQIPSDVLYTGYVINKNCDLNCSYCVATESDFVDTLPATKDIRSDYNNEVLKQIRRLVDSPILKVVGGGEAFLDKTLVSWIKQESVNYPVTFILTNGVNISENDIRELSYLKNLFLGLSLDGHTIEMNTYRFHNNQVLFDKVISHFHLIKKYDIEMQINMVLHDKNIKNFFEYLDFLVDTGYKLTLHTSPVVPKSLGMDISQYKSGWIAIFEQLIEQYDKYRSILLPKGYFEYLIDYYKNDFRRPSRPCYIPYFMSQFFSGGNFTACPIIWTKNIGNVFTYNGDLFEEDIYELIFHKNNLPFFCRKCVTSYDILSLYVENKITDEEMKRIHLYSVPEVFSRIKSIKNGIWGQAKIQENNMYRKKVDKK